MYKGCAALGIHTIDENRGIANNHVIQEVWCMHPTVKCGKGTIAMVIPAPLCYHKREEAML